jgi:hypothetical protein
VIPILEESYELQPYSNPLDYHSWSLCGCSITDYRLSWWMLILFFDLCRQYRPCFDGTYCLYLQGGRRVNEWVNRPIGRKGGMPHSNKNSEQGNFIK